MTAEEPPLRIRARQGVLPAALLAAFALTGVARLFSGPEPALSWSKALLLVFVLVCTGLGLQAWRARAHVHFAEVSESGVKWWVYGEEQFVPFDRVNMVCLPQTEGNQGLELHLSDGSVLRPAPWFPNNSLLFDTIKLRFRGRMRRGQRLEQPGS